MSYKLAGTVQDITTQRTYEVVVQDSGDIDLVPVDDASLSATVSIGYSRSLPRPPAPPDAASISNSQSSSPAIPTAPALPDKLNLNYINPVFRQRLSSVMTDNKYDRVISRRQRGKLGMKHLWRTGVGATNVFSQKQGRKGKHYNVILLVDESGSMHTSAKNYDREIHVAISKLPNTDNEVTTRGMTRISLAAYLAVFLVNHFDKLNINFAVIGFSEECKTAIRHDFGQKPDTQALFDNIIEAEGGSTDMATGLQLATKMLTGLSGQNLVIALSDGRVDDFDLTRRILNANKHLASFFGVGIGDPCDVIADNQQIADATELQPVILDWLTRHIKRG